MHVSVDGVEIYFYTIFDAFCLIEDFLESDMYNKYGGQILFPTKIYGK
jgi:hypothetical protein